MKKKKITLRQIKPNKSIEVEYRNAILVLSEKLKKFVKNEIIPLLKDTQEKYVQDAIASDFDKVFKQFKRKFSKIDVYGFGIASKAMNKIYKNNKQKFSSDLKEKIGIDIFKDNPKLKQLLKAKINENVLLIETQKDEYISDIMTAVYEGITKGERASEIAKDIAKKTGQMTRHIKFIARDQVNKANAMINENMQRSVGVEEYKWSNSGDQRVRGKSNPNGLYKNSRYDHWAREKVTFKWSDPPPDGHPGEPYGCRCTAQPIIEI
jgi:SPP1 gp7 family putative phage head morphogenesis protein